MIRLNRFQRLALVAASIVIAIVLVVQIEDEGLADTPWLAGSIIILALVLVALSGSWKTSAASAVDRPPTPPSRPANLKAEFDGARDTLAESFRHQLRSIDPAAGDWFLGQTGGHVDAVALKGAFMLTLLRRQAKQQGFDATDQMAELRKHAVGQLTYTIMSDLRDMANVDQPPKREDMIKRSAKELVDCELAVRETIKRFASSTTHPMDPVFAIIEKELPLARGGAVDRERVYGPISRNVWSD